MPKKRPLDAAAPLTRRIEQLLRLEWADNKSAMARVLGVSQPVISRVTSGRQEPPASLLLALAKRPRMNLRWLFLGEGEPLTQRDLGAGGGRFCSVARRLLPGAPATSRTCWRAPAGRWRRPTTQTPPTGSPCRPTAPWLRRRRRW